MRFPNPEAKRVQVLFDFNKCFCSKAEKGTGLTHANYKCCYCLDFFEAHYKNTNFFSSWYFFGYFLSGQACPLGNQA